MTPHRSTVPLVLAAAGVALALGARAAFKAGPSGNAAVPEPAKPVDLARYLGLWYEIGRYPVSFERDMDGVTAEYSLRDDGLVQVINTGRKGGPNGPAKVAVGAARPVKDSAGAKLKVSFFGPFFGDYWVLDHGDDYDWSIVGEPSGRFLWLLSRQAHPSTAAREMLWARAAALGYDTERIRPTTH